MENNHDLLHFYAASETDIGNLGLVNNSMGHNRLSLVAHAIMPNFSILRNPSIFAHAIHTIEFSCVTCIVSEYPTPVMYML